MRLRDEFIGEGDFGERPQAIVKDAFDDVKITFRNGGRLR